jgi:hypothetical protein
VVSVNLIITARCCDIHLSCNLHTPQLSPALFDAKCVTQSQAVSQHDRGAPSCVCACVTPLVPADWRCPHCPCCLRLPLIPRLPQPCVARASSAATDHAAPTPARRSRVPQAWCTSPVARHTAQQGMRQLQCATPGWQRGTGAKRDAHVMHEGRRHSFRRRTQQQHRQAPQHACQQPHQHPHQRQQQLGASGRAAGHWHARGVCRRRARGAGAVSGAGAGLRLSRGAARQPPSTIGSAARRRRRRPGGTGCVHVGGAAGAAHAARFAPAPACAAHIARCVCAACRQARPAGAAAAGAASSAVTRHRCQQRQQRGRCAAASGAHAAAGPGGGGARRAAAGAVRQQGQQEQGRRWRQRQHGQH